ncbi:MAG: hypothetical protein AAB345_01445 [Patescibacteria group bacterium]
MSEKRRKRERFSWQIITKSRIYQKTIYEIFPDELSGYSELGRSESGARIPPMLANLDFDANFTICVNKMGNYRKNFVEKVRAFRRVKPSEKEMLVAVIFYEKKRRKQ